MRSTRTAAPALAILFGTSFALGLAGSPARADDDWGERNGLRVPAPAKPEKQVFRGRDVIRNGSFEHGDGGFGIAGGGAAVDERAGRTGTAGDVGGGFSVSSRLGTTRGYLCQPLDLPDRVTAATLEMSWRLEPEDEAAALGGLAVGIGAFRDGALDVAVKALELDARTYPGPGWRRLEHRFTAADLAKLNALLEGPAPAVLIALATGESVRASFDDIRLVVDGERTPPEVPGVLAFTEQTRGGGFEIVTAAPDGSRRETVFATPSTGGACYGLDWRPDGKAICFSSTHEAAWSWFGADLYELSAGGVRRLTNAPSRAELEGDPRPAGRVEVRVRNLLAEGVQGVVYIQGGRKVAPFALGKKGGGGDETKVIVDDVVDLGPGVPQYVAVRVAGKSALGGAPVDVVPGETVTGAIASVDTSLDHRNAGSPCYDRKGERLVFDSTGLFTVPAAGDAPPATDLLGVHLGMHPAFSPVDDRVLYRAAGGAIRAVAPGTREAEVVVDAGAVGLLADPAWLPDGSGLAFAGRTPGALHARENVLVHAFDRKASVPVTAFFNEEVRSPAISPDGRWMALVRTLGGTQGRPRRSELWVLPLGAPRAGWRIDTRGDVGHVAWSRR